MVSWHEPCANHPEREAIFLIDSQFVCYDCEAEILGKKVARGDYDTKPRKTEDDDAP